MPLPPSSLLPWPRLLSMCVSSGHHPLLSRLLSPLLLRLPHPFWSRPRSWMLFDLILERSAWGQATRSHFTDVCRRGGMSADQYAYQFFKDIRPICMFVHMGVTLRSVLRCKTDEWSYGGPGDTDGNATSPSSHEDRYTTLQTRPSNNFIDKSVREGMHLSDKFIMSSEFYTLERTFAHPSPSVGPIQINSVSVHPGL